MSSHSPAGLHDYHFAASGRNDRAVAAATLACAGFFCMLLAAQLAWSEETASWVAPAVSMGIGGVGIASILASIRVAQGGVWSTILGIVCALAIVGACSVPIQLGIVALTWLVAGPCAVVSVVFCALSIPGGRAWDHLIHASELGELERPVETDASRSTALPVAPAIEEPKTSEAPDASAVRVDAEAATFDVVAALLDPADRRVASVWQPTREAA